MSAARFDFGGLIEIGPLVEKSRIAGAALETTEIRDVILVVDRAARVARNRAAASGRHALRMATKCAALSAQIVTSPNSCAPSATRFCPTARSTTTPRPNSRRIRREIEKQRRPIQESLRGYLRRLAEGGTVQDELITIRGERFVIPVKIEQKRRVQGVVHGASSSGQTVFVEPLETIEQNNELVRLLEEELAEIHRILLEMTRRIGAQAAADPGRRRRPRRTGTAIRQSPLRRRLQLRSSDS